MWSRSEGSRRCSRGKMAGCKVWNSANTYGAKRKPYGRVPGARDELINPSNATTTLRMVDVDEVVEQTDEVLVEIGKKIDKLL